ncbi:hypothetical protein B9Z55_002415 [Caenorhabditis nigoni]|uniref:Serine/threonine-protein phosphatase n=3 Tax=Caenorhabditis nigoni TaxID=1611254 RepID=A0A2G5VKL2_9PELO|nr:hypothetical protein B9Z55_002415 [Caenorhabditis nigoni]
MTGIEENWIKQTYEKWELVHLAEMVREIFRDESTLETMSPPCTIVGDIHGQYVDLVRLLNMRLTKEETKQKKTGFSSNRHSIECIALMFALKIHYPKNYILLRGNHETRAINFAYGFKEELTIKLGEADGAEVWEKFNETFSYMPLAALVGGKILCMHGGLSPDLNSLDDIKKIVRPIVDVATNRLAQDLLWSDPTPDQTLATLHKDPLYNKNGVRGLSCTFNEAAVRETCKKLKILKIVRAHQMVPDGFKFFADRQLITIFSAPRYMNETDNRGAVLTVRTDGKVGIIQMKNTKGMKQNVDDEITRGDDLPTNQSAKKKSESMLKTAQSSSSKSKTQE